MSLRQAAPLIGAAVAVGVLAAATGGAGLVLGPTLMFVVGAGFAAGAVLSTFIFNSSANTSQKAASAQTLDIATNSQGFPVTVIFGGVKISGNYIRYDPAFSSTEEIRQSSGGTGGGKGGGGGGGGGETTSVVGYRYRTSFEYCLCMGEIDAVGRIYTSPNQAVVREVATPTPFGGDDSLTISIAGAKSEGGSVRIYKGSPTQGRVTSSDPWGATGLKYRNFCYAVFLQNYCIGEQAAAKTYQFILYRLPRCTRKDGSTVTGIVTRGSLDPEHTNYNEANPAAIGYEALSNSLWGRGIDTDIFDEDSLASASRRCAEENIGMSFTLDQMNKVSDLLNAIKNHCGLVFYFNGEKIKCRWLYDRFGDSYKIAAKLNAEEVIDFQINRPAWTGQTNEVHYEYINKANNYVKEAASEIDNANANSTGVITSESIALTGFATPELARRMALRILRERVYPAATVSFTVTNYNLHLEPTDLIQLTWNEWGDESFTGFFRIISITPNSSGKGLKIAAAEDYLLPPVLGPLPAIALPVPPFDTGGTNNASNPDDRNLPFPAITPILAIEAPLYLYRRMGGELLIAAQKREDYLQSIRLFQFAPSGEFELLQDGPAYGIMGTLAGGIDQGMPFDRQTQIVVTLADYARDRDIAASPDLVLSNSDTFESLLAFNGDLLIIGNEVMQVGKAEDIGGGQIRFSNLARGILGTPIESHLTGVTVAFIKELNSGNIVSLAGIDHNRTTVEFSAHAVVQGRVEPDGTIFGANPANALTWRSYRPYPPNLYSSSLVVDVMDLKLRPKLLTIGAGLQTFEQDAAAMPTDMQGITYVWQPFDVSATALNGQQLLTGEFIPVNPADMETGLFVADPITLPGGTTEIRVWALYNGRYSEHYLTIGA